MQTLNIFMFMSHVCFIFQTGTTWFLHCFSLTPTPFPLPLIIPCTFPWFCGLILKDKLLLNNKGKVFHKFTHSTSRTGYVLPALLNGKI